MKCPACEVVLVMADRAGVEIDYCPQCRGVWLDRGELDKIIAASDRQPVSSADEAAVGSRFRKHDDHDDHGRDPRRKSMWRELFD